MSKNVSVKEGNIARKFRPVDRLNVITDNEQGMWKPESAFKLGTLHVSENGIYIASLNGYAAYSEIDVRVTDKLGSDDPDSYDYITPDPENYPDVWNPDTGDWDETELNDPDEWELPEEFDETDLDTGDLEEPEFDPYDPEASLDDFDPSDLDVSNIKLEDPKLPKETKLKGIDPDTGLDTEVTGIENEDGDMELSTEILPSAIHIVVPPRKRKYKEGDFIDYSGIHVYLLDDHHKLFTCSQYPTGEIPFSELIFPETIATADGEAKKTARADFSEIEDLYPITVASGASLFKYSGVQYGRKYYRAGTYAPFLIVRPSSANSHFWIDASASEGTEHEYYNPPSSWDKDDDPKSIDDYSEHSNKGYASTKFTYDGKTVYYSTTSMGASGEMYESGPYQEVATDTNLNENAKYIAWTIIYGEIKSETATMDVPVQWMRSDGEILEDIFTIEIVSEEEEETGGEEQPQSDPFVGYADISSNGHFYNINRKKVPQIHYANGYVWQEGISTEYSVEQAASLGLIILLR